MQKLYWKRISAFSMGCDGTMLKMSNALPSLRCPLPPNFPEHVSSMKLSNKTIPSLIMSAPLFFRATFPAPAALNTVEPTGDVACNNPCMSPVNLREDDREIPRMCFNSNLAQFLSSSDKHGAEIRVLNVPVDFESKERLKRYSKKLFECATKRTLNQGKAIHGSLIKNEVEPDSHLWISLINFYVKCGCLEAACKILDEMPERDVVSWTALIAGFVSEGYGNDGVSLYCEMRRENVRPNDFALATSLKACSTCLDLEFGKQVHVEAIKAGLLSDLFVGSALVDLYAKCDEMELADRLFVGMPKKNDVSWNVLLNGYAENGDSENVWKLFCQMTECKMKFSKPILSTMLKGSTTSGSLRDGMALHSLVIRSGCELDEFLGCALIDMYSKCGMAQDALKVFKRIKVPDVVTWSAMINGLDQQGHSQEAAKLFHMMRNRGVRPNQFTLASLVSAATNIGDLHFGESLHTCVWKYGVQSHISVSNALIMMYMKSGRVRDGTRVFDAMDDRDLVSWNSFLSGFSDYKTCDRGPRIFYQILVEGLKPNMYTFISILRSCSSLFDVDFGKQVHAHIVKSSINGNDYVGTALVDMYAKSRCLEDADLAFNRLVDRGIFTWSVMISCYAKTNQSEKAIKYFCQMQREAIKPDEFTLAGCLSSCSRMAALENGRQLHAMAIKCGHFDDVFVGSALVDMYGKCGCVEDAEALFGGLVSRDIVSWNTIISGYSQHGQGEKALEAFGMMLDEGIAPSEVTFVSVLSACSYVGLVEEGKYLFDSMNKVYGIAPTIEHYACMVNILGRAGKFAEVETFIEEMELTSCPLIWESILGACKLHANVDFAERAAKKLLELEPNMDSGYVLLSNIFAAKGRWDDVRNVRELMFTRGVKKEPGCSWVEVDSQFHVFMSQDGLHPKMREICSKLEELAHKLASMGYIPKTECMLHNVTDIQKSEHLLYHSEKLAVAFALISTNPGKTIRIFKNLRICADCHDVMKLISDMTDREIVVRDTKRFHHFKRGNCSCQDYW